MPFGSLLAGAALGGAQGLWQYNRENYMFETPLRQSQIYQFHNIVIARFNLFRDDVRDLCALTTSRVQGYLIVNTLQLGFIITVFYNFDRHDDENEMMAYEEAQVNLLFSMLMLTGAFWLLTSIWFSMNGLIVAQSLSTKMLARVVRIPLPTEEEIASAAGDTRAFESHLSDHFRLPMLGRAMEMGRHAQQAPERSRAGFEDATHAYRRQESGGSTTRGHDPAREPRSSPSGTRRHVKGSPREGFAGDEGPTLPRLSILDLVYNEGEPPTDRAAVAIDLGAEPHIKLFRLLAASWEPFDFYGKVSMTMGTASMLSGLAFYGLYYMRTSGATFIVETGGWCAFAFMSVLSWWSLILELNLTRTQHVILGCLTLSGPSLLLFGYFGVRMHWVLPLTVSTSTAWVVLLTWSGVSLGHSWPKVWRASLFMNVLHSQDCLVDHTDDVVWTIVGRPKSLLRAGTADTESTSTTIGSTSTMLDDSPRFEEEHVPDMVGKVSKANLYVGPILASLEYLLDVQNLDKSVSRSLRKQRDYLVEAARANGAANHWRPGRPLSGFWLQLPRGFGAQPTSEWVDPYNLGNPNVSPSVTLVELLKVCQYIGKSLYADAAHWTVRDMRALAEYGGEPVPGVRSFTSQFHREGTGSDKNLGYVAFLFFTAGAVLVTLFWFGALVRSFYMTYYREEMRQSIDQPPLLSGERVPLLWPLPWLDPIGFGCDGKGRELVVTDAAVGAFVLRNSSGAWEGPHTSCGSADVVGGDIGPDGALWLGCPNQLRAHGDPDASGSDLGLRTFALDAMPSNRSKLQGIAARQGRIVGLNRGDDGRWRIAGSINAPLGRNWSSLGLAAGRALILDRVGLLYELDTATGRWRGPFQLPGGDTGDVWRGICAFGESLDFLALSPRGTSLNLQISSPGPPEMWRFKVPSIDEPGPLPQAPAFFERVFGRQ